QVAATAFGAGPLAGRAPFGIELAHADPPAPAGWPQRALLQRITAESRGRPVTVGVIPNAPEFSVSNFRYYAARDGLPLRFGRAWSDYPLNVDYVVLKTGDQGPAFASDKARRVTEQFAADPLLTAAFPALGSYPLPDGSVATLRVRRPAPVTRIAPAALDRFRIERLTLSEEDLQAFLAAGRRTRRVRVRFLPGQAQVHLGAPGPPVDARVSLGPAGDGRPVVLDVHAVRLGGLPVPDLL